MRYAAREFAFMHKAIIILLFEQQDAEEIHCANAMKLLRNWAANCCERKKYGS